MQTPSNQKEKDPQREHELEPLYPSPPHNSLAQTHTMGGGHSLLDPVHPLLALPIEPAQSRHSNPSGQSNASSSIMAFTPETPFFDNAPIKFKSFNNTNSKSGFSNTVSDSGRVTRSQTKRKLEFQSGYHKTVNPICSPPIQQSSSKHNGSTKNFKNMPQIDFDASKYSTASAASIPSALSDYLNPTTNTQSKYSLSSTSQQRAPPPLRISTAEFCSSGYNDSSTSANHLAYSYPPNTQTEPQYQQQQHTYQSQHQNYHPLLTPSNGSNYIPGYPPTSYPTTHGPSSYLPQSPQTSTSFNHLNTTRYSDYTSTSSVQSPMTLLNGIQNTSNSYGMSGSSSNHFTATPSACLPIQQQDHTFPLSYPQQPPQQPSQMYHYGPQIYNQHQQRPNQPYPQSDISSLSSLYPQYQNAHQYLHSHQEHRHHLPPPTQQLLPHQPSAAEPPQQQQRDIIQPQRSRYLPPPMPSSHYPALPRYPYTQPTQQYYQYPVQYPGPAAVVPNPGEVIDLTRSESPYEYGKKRKLDNGVLPAPVAGTSMSSFLCEFSWTRLLPFEKMPTFIPLMRLGLCRAIPLRVAHFLLFVNFAVVVCILRETSKNALGAGVLKPVSKGRWRRGSAEIVVLCLFMLPMLLLGAASFATADDLLEGIADVEFGGVGIADLVAVSTFAREADTIGEGIFAGLMRLGRENGKQLGELTAKRRQLSLSDDDSNDSDQTSEGEQIDVFNSGRPSQKAAAHFKGAQTIGSWNGSGAGEVKLESPRFFAPTETTGLEELFAEKVRLREDVEGRKGGVLDWFKMFSG
ncbi:hypothetical protein HDU78_009137 [Chytriomyces hyalinus]|nr:hypothetical protein HDU78_009137 [Chytriomyces hyalinus]